MKSIKNNDAIGMKYDKIDWLPFETDTRENFFRISEILYKINGIKNFLS